MWDKLKDWLRQWLGIEVNTADSNSPDSAVRQYENITADNVGATIANKLAMLTFADSTMEVQETGRQEPGPRVALIAGVLNELWDMDASWITAQALGKGGKVLIPVVHGDKVRIDVIDHNRMLIRAMDGRRITSATLIADTETLNDMKYYLLADYTLENGVQTIRYRVKAENGGWYDVGQIAKWAGITPEITIGNTDRLLFAYLRCPRDNRTDNKQLGVPVTYGAEAIIAELVEHANIYRREYKLTRPMLGLDAALWKVLPDGKRGIDDVHKTVQDSDVPFVPVDNYYGDGGKAPWMIFAPAIRDESMYNRLDRLFEMLEKSVGVSRGILTQRETATATATEIRAANHDTFAYISAIRDMVQNGMDELAYAFDMLCEAFGLSPAGARGDYSVKISWDMSLFESSDETFRQYSELHAAGTMSDAEWRAWVTGEKLEEAEKAVKKAQKERQQNDGAINRILNEPDPDEGGEE